MIVKVNSLDDHVYSSTQPKIFISLSFFKAVFRNSCPGFLNDIQSLIGFCSISTLLHWCWVQAMGRPVHDWWHFIVFVMRRKTFSALAVYLPCYCQSDSFPMDLHCCIPPRFLRRWLSHTANIFFFFSSPTSPVSWICGILWKAAGNKVLNVSI